MSAATPPGEGLKPCPFCGNDGSGLAENALHVSHTQNDWHPAYDCYCVQCDKCTATMGYLDSEEAAIAAWNTRAADKGGEVVGDEDPCPNGSHCYCCGPGDTCCDCGVVLLDIDKLVALERWTDFLDENPDDLTSPEDLPDHALVTFEQFYEMARAILPSVPAAPSAPTPANLGDALAEDVLAAIAVAYAMGAHDAHEDRREDRFPDFSEAASDYAKTVIGRLFPALYREGKPA